MEKKFMKSIKKRKKRKPHSPKYFLDRYELRMLREALELDGKREQGYIS
jgi:hypothetical protein